MDVNSLFKDKRYDLLFRLAFSARYHQRRESFYEFWDKFAKAIAVIGGAAAISTLLDRWHPDIKTWIAAVITFTSTLSLVFGLSQKARLHLELRRRYGLLESRLISLADGDMESLKKIESEISLIESDEPPILATLVQLCQNEVARAWDRPDHIHNVQLLKRLFANFFDLEASGRLNTRSPN